MLLNGAWRGAWDDAKRIQQRLLKLLYLFLLYLIFLALLILTEIVEHLEADGWFFLFDLYAFLLVYSFTWSFWLPFEIKSILVERLEREIGLRKDRDAGHASNR